MKKYLDQLRPMERRLVVGVIVVVVLVLNWWFIWPHFSDWSDLNVRQAAAQTTLKRYQTAVAQIPALKRQLKTFENDGEIVAPEDQAVNFMRTVQTQSLQSGVAIVNNSSQLTQTNDLFFVLQVQNVNVQATEEQLVDFLYKLGSGSSMIRVRDLELQPDAPRQRLNARIRLVASYQKNPASAKAAKTSTAMAK